jgi:hypothetical protein
MSAPPFGKSRLELRYSCGIEEGNVMASRFFGYAAYKIR